MKPAVSPGNANPLILTGSQGIGGSIPSVHYPKAWGYVRCENAKSGRVGAQGKWPLFPSKRACKSACRYTVAAWEQGRMPIAAKHHEPLAVVLGIPVDELPLT